MSLVNQDGENKPAVAESTAAGFPASAGAPDRIYTYQTARLAADRKAPIIPHAVDQAVLERYRRLRTRLLQLQAMSSYRSVMVTSAAPQEGKTLTVLNLAFSFGMIPGFRVAVVDGDLRRGQIGHLLGAADRPGLMELLSGEASLDDVMITSEGWPVHFVLSGQTRSAGTELMHSGRLRDQIQLIAGRFDLVLVDSAPANVIADAQLMAGACDALLLVARAFVTTRKEFEKLVADLQPLRILGAVLNGGTQAKKHYKSYY